jgi:hypothetical protein
MSRDLECCAALRVNSRLYQGRKLYALSLTTILVVATVMPALGQSCDPNYVGACVPNVAPEDVDCLGGEGNGPYFPDRYGPFEVVGEDVYDLDTNDRDNLACEPPRN